MFMLHKQKNIIGEGGKCGKTATETCHQQHICCGRDDAVSLGESKQRTYYKTADDVHSKCSERKSS